MNIETTTAPRDDGMVIRVHEGETPSPIAIEVTRGGMVESVHRAIAVISDAKGGIIKAWGAVDRPIFARSAIKPLQTMVVIETGAADNYCLGEDEIALCCASHHGEQIHVDRVVSWLRRLGLGISDLECGPQLPTDEVSAHALIRLGAAPTRAHNNCSGKHSGMLTTAIHMGEPVVGYTLPDHPVQKRLVALMQDLGEVDLTGTARGLDGCGIPVFGAPLKSIALAMAKLADPSGQSESRQAVCHRIIKACASNPLMLSGTNAFNSLVLAETGENCLLKGGAEGVYTAAIPKQGLGICIKVDDGGGRASSALILALLRHLGVVDEMAAERIETTVVRDVRNWAGTLVGEIRPSAWVSF
ncbi:MAG: L-asparaginase II [Rhodospirillaceae bacterium]|nr:L-asparaginase II [Rhodospirillaceae bacterium]